MTIAASLSQRATDSPTHPAVTFLDQTLTYDELNQKANQLALGFTQLGIQKGHRVILMVRPSLEFTFITFALFKIGAVCVLIDPGIGFWHLKKCIAHVQPDFFIGIPKSFLLRGLFPKSFRTLKRSICVGPKWFFHFPTIISLMKNKPKTFDDTPSAAWEPAAIIFTTGSTGPPKGVVYEQGMFEAQLEILKKHFKVSEKDIDMPTFPLFALFSVAFGTHCILPNMDPTRPAHVNPKMICENILNHKVTMMFGSPALWNRVTRYCLKFGIQLPSLQKILIAGAPVSENLLRRFDKILSPTAHVYTPYGATEALPVSLIERKERHAGFGIEIGKPAFNTNVQILRITDQPLKKFTTADLMHTGSVGEIMVSGAHVTKTYFEDPINTALAKTIDTEGHLWHRMGDVGYFDAHENLWYCGRKKHRVQTPSKTYFTIPVENIFNQHADVFRSALVGVGHTPIIIIEPKDKSILKESPRLLRLKEELQILARSSNLTQDISELLFYADFPVDIRHNAKINREKLALWARKKLGNTL